MVKFTVENLEAAKTLYFDFELSISEVAEQIQVDASTIYQWFRDSGVKLRPQGGKRRLDLDKLAAYNERKKGFVRASNKKAVQRNKDFISKVKANTPCMDCDVQYPECVMDFDHRVPVDKKGTISHGVYWPWSLERLQEEVAKCDLVCANCHRIRTHGCA